MDVLLQVGKDGELQNSGVDYLRNCEIRVLKGANSIHLVTGQR